MEDGGSNTMERDGNTDNKVVDDPAPHVHDNVEPSSVDQETAGDEAAHPDADVQDQEGEGGGESEIRIESVASQADEPTDNASASAPSLELDNADEDVMDVGDDAEVDVQEGPGPVAAVPPTPPCSASDVASWILDALVTSAVERGEERRWGGGSKVGSISIASVASLAEGGKGDEGKVIGRLVPSL